MLLYAEPVVVCNNTLIRIYLTGGRIIDQINFKQSVVADYNTININVFSLISEKKVIQLHGKHNPGNSMPSKQKSDGYLEGLTSW